MTYETMSTAMRAIEKLFREAWKDSSDNALPCDYPGSTFNPDKLARNTVWARYRIQHNTSGQTTLSSANGGRRYSRSGNIMVQVFVPQDSGVIDAYHMAEKVVNAYEGKEAPGGAWFRNVRPIEIGISDDGNGETNNGLWYQINVFADFEYEQFK